MSNKVSLRPATVSDAWRFYGRAPIYSFRGYAAELDGDIVAIGGVYSEDGKLIVFSEMKDAMRPYKKAIAKGCRMLMQMLDKTGRPTYAFASPNEPSSGYLLAKLGFKPTGMMGPHGDILVRS